MALVTGCGVNAPELNQFDHLPAVGDFELPPALDPTALNLGALAIEQLREHGVAVIPFKTGAEQAIVDEGFEEAATFFDYFAPDHISGARFCGGVNAGYRLHQIQANPQDKDQNDTFNVGPLGTFIPNRYLIETQVTAFERVRLVLVRRLMQVLEALPLTAHPSLEKGSVMGVNCYRRPGVKHQTRQQQGPHCDGVPLTALIINRPGLEIRCADGYRRVRPDITRMLIISSGILEGLGQPTVHRVLVDSQDLLGRITFVCFGAPHPDDPNTALINPLLPEQIRAAVESFDLGTDFYRWTTEAEGWHRRGNPTIPSPTGTV